LAILPFLPEFRVMSWEYKILLSVLMLVLTLLAGWFTFRLAKEPLSGIGKPILAPGLSSRAIVWSEEQRQLLRKAADCEARKDFNGAEVFLDQLMALISDPSSDSYVQALLMKLHSIFCQNAIERAEKACLEFVNRDVSTEQKLRVLDGFVCQIVYQPVPLFLQNAERLARLALELAPGTPTLKGSLGGILAEREKFAEAEPLLRECLDSPMLHDQGIASFYLGVVKLKTGHIEEAKRLINRGMTLYPEAWLMAKAKARLESIN
jgi:tetratricopeptide (TPR) repeat protein